MEFVKYPIAVAALALGQQAPSYNICLIAQAVLGLAGDLLAKHGYVDENLGNSAFRFSEFDFTSNPPRMSYQREINYSQEVLSFHEG